MNKNMNKTDAIKKENKKALKVFIPLIILAGVIGGVFGWFSTSISEQGTVQSLADMVEHLLYVSAPYLLILLEVVTAMVGLVGYQRGKAMFAGYETIEDDEEAEKVYNKADRFLSLVLSFMTTGLIVCFFFFSVTMIDIRINIMERAGLLILSLAAIFAGGLIHMIVQQKIVDLVKRMTPGLEGSVYDLNFGEKWEASCDEAQKMTIYKASFKAYSATQKCCAVLWILCSLAGFIFEVGYLPTLMVTIIWLVSSITYFVEGFRLEHSKINE